MSSHFRNGLQLSILIRSFLKGKAKPEITASRLESIIKKAEISKLSCTNIYHLLSRFSNNPFSTIMRTADKQLMNHKPCYKLTQSDSSQMSYLLLHVFRLRTLIKHNIQCEVPSQKLTEIILLQDQISNTELLSLLSLLPTKPNSYASHYKNLIKTIFDTFHQKLTESDNFLNHEQFLIEAVHCVAQSFYKVPLEITRLMNELIQSIIANYDYESITKLSFEERQKSTAQLMKYGLMQTSAIRKRVTFQLMTVKTKKGLQLNEGLPGRLWNNSKELHQALHWLKSIGTKEPYVQLFTINGEEYALSIENTCYLDKPEFMNYYIENIFIFIKSAHLRLDQYTVCRMVRVLRSCFVGQSGQFEQVFFRQFNEAKRLDLFKLMVVLYELKRYNLNQIPSFLQTIHEMLLIVANCLDVSYISRYEFSSYRTKQELLVYSFIYEQLVAHIEVQTQQNLAQTAHSNLYLSLVNLQAILKQQKQQKNIDNQYTRLSAFFQFTKAVLTQAKRKGNSKDIIQSQLITESQVVQILELNEQQKMSTDQLKTIVSTFLLRFTVHKHVLLQPNINIEYIIVDNQAQKIVAAFDYQQLLVDRFTYTGITNQQHTEQTIDEDHPLTLYRSWRKKIMESFYESQYYYCINETDLSLKFERVLLNSKR